MTTVTDLEWRQIIVGGIAPHVISTGVLIVAIVSYSFLLAFGPGGGPDPESLQEFNTVSGTQLYPLVTILLTVATARWVAQRVDPTAATLHGVAVGLLAGVVGLAFGALDAMMVIRFICTVGAGVIGVRLSPVLFGD